MALNPKSMKMDIGVRTQRQIVIYPLSMADELKFTSTVSDAYSTFSQLQEEKDSELQIAQFIVSAIQENLTSIMVMICEEEVTLDQITNEQFADICELIYDMNFAGALGKFISLWTKIKKSFPQTKPLPNLSSPPATE
jgi:hypothetical protein